MTGAGAARREGGGGDERGEEAENAQAAAPHATAPEGPGKRVSPLPRPRISAQALTVGQVLSIQVYVDVGSPLGQPGGAVILRIGIVMIRFGSRIWNG